METEVLERVDGVRACVFTLGGDGFAIEVRCAREVVVVDDVTIVPRGPSYLVGVANLRGRVLSIVDIRALLGLAPRPVGRGTRVLVVQAGSSQVGVAVDAVLGLTSFDELLPLGEAARRAYGEFGVGLARHGDGVVTLLDAERTLEALKRGGGD
jgi:purine-binding chemotaxis protein CheW